MDYKIVVASPALENAVKSHFDVQHPPRRFGRSSLRDVVVPAGGEEYTGYFKIIQTETGYAVVNGRNYNDPYCGTTDIPNKNYVPRTEFPSSFRGGIYLYAIYDKESEQYTVTLGNLPSPSPSLYRQIGSIGDMYGIVQTYTDGWSINFGREYFL
jgi:hypothetical protein